MNGKVYLAYENESTTIIPTYHIFFQNSSDGMFFGTIRNISYVQSSSVSVNTPSIACDNNSKVHLVWAGPQTGATVTSIQYRNTTNGGSTWSATVNLTTGDPTSAWGDIYPNILWATFPIKNGKRPDILKKGWALVYTKTTAASNVYFMKSADVIWNTTGGPYLTYSYPSNASTNIAPGPTCAITVNTPLSHTLTVTWFENSTGNYINRQVNTSVSPGSTIRYHDTYATAAIHWYWWHIHVNDGTTNNSWTYHFQICGNPLITNPSPANSSTGIALSPKTNITVNDPIGQKMTVKFISNATSAPYVFRPNNNGTSTQLSPGGDTYNWECVDDVVADDGTTYVYNSGKPWKNDTYNIPNHVTQSFPIYNVTVHARVDGWGHATTPVYTTSYAITIKSGTHYFNGDTHTYTSSVRWVDIQYTWLTNPNTSVAWNWADIDALEIGISSASGGIAGHYTYCSQVYAEINPGPISGWYVYGQNSSVNNWTYSQGLTSASVNGKWWCWRVMVNDSSYTNTSDVFW
ncbi:MAG: hypothetical protein NT038_09560, partial [Euryarchaeota archaeon]|nr:hypothetical protein [Euryarchaeota archaeon]